MHFWTHFLFIKTTKKLSNKLFTCKNFQLAVNRYIHCRKRLTGKSKEISITLLEIKDIRVSWVTKWELLSKDVKKKKIDVKNKAKIRLKMKVLTCPQHFSHYKSMGAFGCHENQSLDPICPKTLCSQWSCKIWSRLADWPQKYSSKQFLHYKSLGKNFNAKGHVTPKRSVQSGPKSNSSEIFCLSSLPSSLKIQSKMKCPHFCPSSRMLNSKVNWRFKLIQDFMPVLVTCKFDNNPIKNENAKVTTTFHQKPIGKFFDAEGEVTLKQSLIWPKIELVRDLMPVQVTC